MPEGTFETSLDKTALFRAAEGKLGLPEAKLERVREIITTLPARDLKWIASSQDNTQAIERFKKSLMPQEIKDLFAE